MTRSLLFTIVLLLFLTCATVQAGEWVERSDNLTDTSNHHSWQQYPNGKYTDSNSDWEFRASTEGRSNGELPPPQKTIYVDDDFVDDPPKHKWNTIQEGINDANSGDTIIVSDGIYNENLNVYKRLTIRSENGADATIVQAASSSDHVFEVTANWVNITGFTVTWATAPGASLDVGISGIRLSYACYCNISNNNASNNNCGIYLYHSNNNMLMSNNASDNNHGIFLLGSSSNTLTSNTASDNEYGIYLHYSSSNTFMNNTVSYNGRGISLSCSSSNTLTSNTASDNNHEGIDLFYSSSSTLTSNTASDNGCGIYLESSDDNMLTSNTVSDNEYGIYLWDSSDNTLTNNNCSNNTLGIWLSSSSNNTLMNNTASYNGRGIYLEHSSNNNIITNNTASYNNGSGNYGGRGIFLLFSGNNTLKDNNASNNSIRGITLCESCNNLLYHNNLINNNGDAYDSSSDIVCTNFWNSQTEGNYYSDYAGCDNDIDGIGDTPHPIPRGSSVDYFPLMQPWSEDTQQKGDLNGDGQITAADAAIALGMAVSGERGDDVDMDGDGWVSSVDALMILQAAGEVIKL